MNNKSLIGLIVAVVVALVAWNSFYIVAQTERAVLLQFGRVVQPDVQPGLHVKIPYVNQVRIFDGRLLTLDSTPSRFLTLEKKALMVDAYAKWRVKDAERFYQSTSGMKQVADEIREKWSVVEGIAIVQRIGRLYPKTPTVLIACTAAHRDTGVFEAARYGIDRLKEIVPVWKKEVGPDGQEWVEGDYIPKPGE